MPNVVDSDDWYTPAWVFDGLGLTFHLDVAAPDEPVSWIPARRSYTVADDGLTQPWYGVVWCNPPYSSPTAWCKRWAEHADGLILLRADLSTSGPHAAVNAASSVYVPKRRLQFVSALGHPSGAVNFSTVILGRGMTADAALGRLSAKYGGTTRRLTSLVAIAT